MQGDLSQSTAWKPSIFLAVYRFLLLLPLTVIPLHLLFHLLNFFAEYSLVSLVVKMEETWSSEKNLKWAVLIFLKGIKIAWINTLPILPPPHARTHTDIFFLLEDKTVS